MIYEVRATETMATTYRVTADTPDEATAKVEQLGRTGDDVDQTDASVFDVEVTDVLELEADAA